MDALRKHITAEGTMAASGCAGDVNRNLEIGDLARNGNRVAGLEYHKLK